MDRNLARRTAAIHRSPQSGERPLKRISTTEGKEENRDPDADVEDRRDFVEHYGRLPPRTKLYVAKDEFPIPLNYIDVERQLITGIDVLREATIDDYWNIDGE